MELKFEWYVWLRCKDSLNLNEAAMHEYDAARAISSKSTSSTASTGIPTTSSMHDVIGKPVGGASPGSGKRERRRVSESSTTRGYETTTSTTTDLGSLAAEKTTSLPRTLSYLVLFWDELCKSTSKKIAENQIMTGPGSRSTAEATTKTVAKFKVRSWKEDHGDSGKVSVPVKKSGHGAKLAGPSGVLPPPPAALRGNLFGAAADQLLAKVSAADKDFEVLCELCGEEFPHPVTYHMRQAHPGCGKPAGGQGYNSGGLSLIHISEPTRPY